MTLTFVLRSFQGHVNHCVHSTLNISETVRYRGLVPKDHQQEMAYRVSNGHVIDDVRWPERSNSWPQYP